MTAGDVAAAALAVQHTGTPVAAVLIVCDGIPAARVLVSNSTISHGTLGDATLDAAAVELAMEAIANRSALSRVVHIGETPHFLYAEAFIPTERLVIVGAGHIAVPLAQLGIMIGLDVAVLDDREEFATEERFADGVTVMRADFRRDPFAGVIIDSRTYLTLVTRGHRWDFDCLTRLLERGDMPAYIGMIGSKRRVRAAFEALSAAGIDRARLGRIHAPIGIDIGADTPAEIAVSIVAEIIAIRRGGGGADRARGAVALTNRQQVVDGLMHGES
ncbi:MAG: XdhC family protein [Longimicrobiales bacterium]